MTVSRADLPTVQPVPAVPEPAILDDRPRRRLTKKRLTAAAAVLILAGAGTAAYLTIGGTSTPSNVGAPLSVTDEAVKVTTGTMTQTVSASGTLTPAEDDTLSFDVSGTVTAVDVTTGQSVTDGQTLAIIDSTALSDQVAADQATLTSDEDRLATDEDDSASTSTIDSDEAQITSAESQLASAETDLSDATLKATFSGTVAAVNLAVGDVVGSSGGGGASGSTSAAGASTTSSSEGITVISSDSYTMTTSVDDTEVGEVKAGDEVSITPSGSSSALTGTVASVSLIASSSSSSGSSSGVASFPVVIDVTGSPNGIYPGDSATASIVVKQIQNAIEVPTAALSYADGQATVTKVVNGSRTTQAVTTGVTLNGETQIISGLTAGDTIMEQVVKFNAQSGGSARSLFGNSTRGGGTGGFPSGGFPGGGNFTGGTGGGGSAQGGAAGGGR
jgi:membrane fusion protein, macrolide-specific efflux system